MPFSIGAILPLAVRLWLGRKLYRLEGPDVVRVSKSRIIKCNAYPCEVEAMKYVAQHTSIPVPKVLATHPQGELVSIEMEYIPGINLGEAWAAQDCLSGDQKKTILKELGDYINQLRRLKPPAPGIVSSALQHSIRDPRVGNSSGPLTLDEFHKLIRGGVPMETCAELFGEKTAKVQAQSYATHFTHADLVPRNIIVRDGHIAAVINWSFSGWYPEYWEFTKAHYDLFPEQDWYQALYEVITRYHDELIAERSLWTKLLEPGQSPGCPAEKR